MWIYTSTLLALLVLTCYGDVAIVSVEEQSRGISEANETCQEQIEMESGRANDSYCERAWDTLACWPPTPAGSVAKIPCPSYLNGFIKTEYAYKLCTLNGTWFYHPLLNLTWTDYTQCTDKTMIKFPELIEKHMPYIRVIYNIGYGISLVCLVVATVIMVSFRRLRCPRNTIHINLFVSFILRASVSFMKENLLVKGLAFPSDVIEVDENSFAFIPNKSHWECKLFFTIFHYILSTNYVWILVEGLYLNMLITLAVFSEKSGIMWFIVFGWASPLLFVGPWVIVRAKLDDYLCWNTHLVRGYFWIMRGPIVLTVAINFIIFLNIIRVLFTKLTAFNSFETKKFRYRKLAKSTMVLIPLFGVHYIVFIGLPDEVSDKAELVKLYFEMFFNSIQGFIVSLLFCFLNGEVQTEISKKWKRFNLSHGRGHLSSNRDTIMSYVSRARGSIGSNSNSDCDHKDKRKSSDIELQKLTNGERINYSNKNEKPNGHVRFSEESRPMLKTTE